MKLTEEKLRALMTEAESLCREAESVPVREVLIRYLEKKLIGQPEKVFRDGRTAEQIVDRLIEGINTFPGNGFPPAAGLRQTLINVITQQEMTSLQARNYLALMGVLAENMEKGGLMTNPDGDSGKIQKMLENRIQARLDRYADMTVEAQIECLLNDVNPNLKPKLVRISRMRELQAALEPLDSVHREDALKRISSLCANRDFALMIAGLGYAEEMMDYKDYYFTVDSDPAAFAVSTVYSLSVTEACSLELSEQIDSREAEDMITKSQEETLFYSAIILGILVACIGVETVDKLASLAIPFFASEFFFTSGLILVLILAFVAGVVSFALLSKACAVHNARQYVRDLDPPQENEDYSGEYVEEYFDPATFEPYY